jgi:surface protein
VDWLPLPAIQPGEQKLVGLVAIYPGEGNVLAVRAAGNYTVDWGDGTVEHVSSPAQTIRRHQEWFGNSLYGPADRFWITAASNTSWQQRIEGTFLVYRNGNRLSASEYRIEENNGNVELVLTTPLPSGVYSSFYGSWSWGETVIEPIKAEHRYSYNTVSAASRCSWGYRQVIVTITPQAGANLTMVDLSPQHSSISQDDASAPWLDLALNLPRAEGGASIVFCGYERYSTYVQLPPLPHVTTASEAFYECTSLRQLKLEGMASLSDASHLVYGCNLLKQLRLAGITSLTSLEWACQEAPDLERVWIEDAEALESTANLFYKRRSLRQVVITGAERIEQMGGMFLYCSALEVAPELHTAEVVDMHEMFANCTSLRHVPQYDTANVTTMESMFSGCRALETIPPFDTRKVTTMRWMFSSCTTLSRLPRLDLRALETMEGMFSGCYGLITLPLLNTEAVQTMTYTFSGCYGLMNLPALPLGNVSNGQSVDVGSNSGTNELSTADLAIATAKGWKVLY